VHPEPRAAAAGQRRPLLLVALGVFLYSTGPVLVQASSLSGPEFSLWRLWFGVPLLGTVLLLQGRRGGGGLTRAGLRWILVAGVAFGGHQLLFMTAVKLTSVADVMLMNTLSPVVVGIAAIPLFGERPHPAFRLWSLVALGGGALVATSGATRPGGDPAGMAMAALNVVLFAVFFLVSKKGRDDVGVVPFLAGMLLVAAVTVSLFAALAGEVGRPPAGRDLVLVLAVAAGPGALGHFVMTWPLRWVRANVPPLMRLAQPFVAGLLAWAFLGEAVTAAHLLGGAATIGGACGAVLTPSGRRFAIEPAAAREPDG
jgi:drug/metabolite transporter (DMT)-like permease